MTSSRSRKKREARRRTIQWRTFLPSLEGIRQLGHALATHPLRAICLGLLGLFLIGFIATTSLPLALAERAPHLALLLSPNHSRALLTLAREERRALEASVEASTESADGTNTDSAVDADPAPEAAPSVPHTADTVDPQTRRETIRQLSTRIIQTAPLSAEAYRLLGEMSPDPEDARQAMIEAVARARRESMAVFWLMHDDYERGDAAGVVRMADHLLRTRPQLNRFTLSYLNSLMQTPEGRSALAAALQTNPPWRARFLGGLGQRTIAPDAALALFEQLKAADSAPSESELIPFLTARMNADRSASAAYNIWLQLMPMEQLAAVRPINNLDFAQQPSGSPFDWQIPRSPNIFIDFQTRAEGEPGRILRLRFGVGRFQFGGIRQVIFLRPGTYRFEGMQLGRMSARRGMRWQILCFTGGRLVGQSDQLLGAPREWRPFTFDFTIPNDAQCQAQTLRLIHDARSPSEQLASGEIMFADLKVVPIPADGTE